MGIYIKEYNIYIKEYNIYVLMVRNIFIILGKLYPQHGAWTHNHASMVINIFNSDVQVVF